MPSYVMTMVNGTYQMLGHADYRAFVSTLEEMRDNGAIVQEDLEEFKKDFAVCEAEMVYKEFKNEKLAASVTVLERSQVTEAMVAHWLREMTEGLTSSVSDALKELVQAVMEIDSRVDELSQGHPVRAAGVFPKDHVIEQLEAARSSIRSNEDMADKLRHATGVTQARKTLDKFVASFLTGSQNDGV